MTSRDLVVGLGCRPGVALSSVRGVVGELLARHGLDPLAVRAYATLDARASEPALRALAGDRLLAYPARVLAEVVVPNPSALAAAAVGTPGVAEAAALHAAAVLASPGGSARLVGEKLRGRSVTAAVARIVPGDSLG